MNWLNSIILCNPYCFKSRKNMFIFYFLALFNIKTDFQTNFQFSKPAYYTKQKYFCNIQINILSNFSISRRFKRFSHTVVWKSFDSAESMNHEVTPAWRVLVLRRAMIGFPDDNTHQGGRRISGYTYTLNTRKTDFTWVAT